MTFQGKHKSNTDYYTLFLSRIKKNRLQGGEPGFHNGVYQKHLVKLIETSNLTTTEFAERGSAIREELEKKRESRLVRNFWVACLFTVQTRTGTDR